MPQLHFLLVSSEQTLQVQLFKENVEKQKVLSLFNRLPQLPIPLNFVTLYDAAVTLAKRERIHKSSQICKAATKACDSFLYLCFYWSIFVIFPLVKY